MPESKLTWQPEVAARKEWLRFVAEVIAGAADTMEACGPMMADLPCGGGPKHWQEVVRDLNTQALWIRDRVSEAVDAVHRQG